MLQDTQDQLIQGCGCGVGVGGQGAGERGVKTVHGQLCEWQVKCRWIQCRGYSTLWNMLALQHCRTSMYYIVSLPVPMAMPAQAQAQAHTCVGWCADQHMCLGPLSLAQHSSRTPAEQPKALRVIAGHAWGAQHSNSNSSMTEHHVVGIGSGRKDPMSSTSQDGI
jgi:hypothetical protein